MCVPLPLSLSLCSLRPIDVEFMQRMHNCVNIIPVIGKADTLTVEEREAFKARVSGGGGAPASTRDNYHKLSLSWRSLELCFQLSLDSRGSSFPWHQDLPQCVWSGGR